MSRFNRSLALAAVSFAALVTAQGAAQAGGFALREQSTTAQGYSFAGAASGSGGLSSMFWNPATITQAGLGLTAEAAGTIDSPRSNITPLLAISPTGIWS